MYRTVFLNSIVVLLLMGCSSKKPTAALPYYNTPDFTPLLLNTSEAAAAVTHTVPAFHCTDQEGRTIGLQNVAGKIHVANFFFTACGSICPAMMANLKTAHDVFEKDTNVVFLSFSVTPWRDSVARLKAYAESSGINAANWHLLTGDKAAVYTLARTGYFAEEDLGFSKDSTQFLHTEHILLVDKHLRIRGIYNGTLALETNQLAKDIEILKQE
ncbi:MAG: SCO family protein [Bacteroidetes bacterium]|nr:SCO family protein [Bacteroidota bacterium]